MRLANRTVATTAAFMALATGLPAAAAAQQVAASGDFAVQSGPSYRYCSAGTFTGWVAFWYIYNASYGEVTWVGRIDFRIDASDPNDRTSTDGDVTWTDSTHYQDAVRRVRQDGRWYTYDVGGQALFKTATGGYPRDRGTVTAAFAFIDQGRVHHCAVSWTM